jgi:hypothetical protein
MSDAGPVPIIRNEAAGRFEATVDGHLAELVYRRADDRLVLVHTGVPDAIAGHGLAGRLAQAALDYAAEQGLSVVPQCPYVRSWLTRHPEVAETVTVLPV